VENKNKQIKTLLNYFRINNNSYNYVDILDEVAYTINNSKHAVTGYTPMELHKGRQVEKSYSILASDQQETEGEFIDEPTDAELENYYHRSNALYDERVNHVKNTIKGVARKREQRQKNQTELRNGSYVYVLSYVTHSSEIQGVFIRVGENTHEPNPLRLRSIAKQPRTLFSEFELKGPKKYYKFVFQITGIVKDRHAVTRYHRSGNEQTTTVRGGARVPQGGQRRRLQTRIQPKPPGPVRSDTNRYAQQNETNTPQRSVHRPDAKTFY
jgi:hypothetical protein